MRRDLAAATAAALAAAIGAALLVSRSCPGRTTGSPSADDEILRPPDGRVISRLQSVPLYASALRANALRSGTVDADGSLHVVLDLRALVEPRLASLGFGDGSGLLPATARGTIVFEPPARPGSSPLMRETWTFAGTATVFDLLDRSAPGSPSILTSDAIPGAPSATVRAQLNPKRLADPEFGGAALAAWRDRAEFAEKLLGRPLRAEIAADLAGPAVFALYDKDDEGEAEAILAFELSRADRIAGLLDTLLALGALTERATVTRYRGVAAGSFGAGSGGRRLAVAVDGSVLLVATSLARLESAIDARRGVLRTGTVPAAADRGREASWSAVSGSAFVAHGWARMARAASPPANAARTTTAILRPVGASGWRLEGRGYAPAITADPIVPFLRSVFAKRQREGD